MKNNTQIKIAIACLFLVCFLSTKNSVAQDERLRCGTTEEQGKLFDAHPEMLLEYQKEDARLRAIDKVAAANGYKHLEKTQSVIYTIPIVFHVINTGGSENISDAQIIDQVRVLNEDYRKKNFDTADVVPAFQGIVDDAGFQFRLAQRDPNGNCTNGIDRIYSTLTNNADDNSKLNDWNHTKYLNVWTVASLANGAAAYAYYPGAASAAADGVIILSNYVGSIGTSDTIRSRTLSHEIGHYFNLEHPWGNNNSAGVTCGDDGVSDTPITKGFSSCALSNCTICTAGIEENVQNHMDYSYCDNMFTQGQVVRMRAAATGTAGSRNNLWTNANLTATGVSTPNVLCHADFVTNNTLNVICPGDSIKYTSTSYNGHPTSWNWAFPGGTPSASTDSTPTITYNTAGLYNASLTVSNASGNVNATKTAYIRVNPLTAMYSNSFYFEGFETSSIPNNDWYVNNIVPGGNTWVQTNTAAATGTKSVMITNTTASAGNVDELIGPSINFSSITGSSVGITFKEAYAQRTTSSVDLLKVYVSTNCGKNWTLRGAFSASNLVTAPVQTTNFVPTASQWATKSVILSSFSSSTDLFFKFQFTSQGGNNIYIDDINITGATGVDELRDDLNITIFPNPASNSITVNFTKVEGIKTVRIYNVLGEKVNSEQVTGNDKVIDISSFSKGVYFIEAQTMNGTIRKKFVKE